MTGEPKRRYSLFPKPLGQCVESITRPALKAQGLAGSRLLTEWDKIAGATLSRRSIPEKLAFPPGKKIGGTLTIAVENGFALEVQHMQPVILERLAGYFGYKAVARITISPRSLPARPKGQDARVKPVLPVACRTMPEAVDNVELQAALTALANTLSGG